MNKIISTALLTARVAKEIVVTTAMATACGAIAAGVAFSSLAKQRSEAFVAREADKKVMA